jgi:peptidoglycan/xylan/chitin deacetylase (PgdA/CDA1 family)/ketosteroid isomerase-like protein
MRRMSGRQALRALDFVLCALLLGLLYPGAVAQAAVTATSPPTASAGPRPIAVTVDDLPIGMPNLHPDPADREQVTKCLLEILAHHKIPATAFVVWGQVRGPQDEALLTAWLRAGHTLGNHTFGHPDLTRLDLDAWLADMEQGRAGLAAWLQARGAVLRYFRFPFLDEGDTGAKWDAVRRALRDSGQRTVPVTIDTQDWSFEKRLLDARQGSDRNAVDDVLSSYEETLRGDVLWHESRGDELFGRKTPQIILLHANAVGAAGWDHLFTWLERTGHRFATAEEVLKDPAVAEEPRFLGRHGCGQWDRIASLRDADETKAAIAKVIADQVEAWNRGDLKAFCSVYDDEAEFLSPTGTVRGRDAVEKRYRDRYGETSAKMGRLRLDIDDIDPVWGMEVTPGGDAVPGAIHGASVVGRWTLTYADKPEASGRTLLVLKRRGQVWSIVRDASM